MKVLNGKGNPIFKKAFMLGKNHVKITAVSARRSEYGKPLFEITFERSSALYGGKKIDFAPMQFIFPYSDDRLIALCALFGDSLLFVPLPDKEVLNGLYMILKSYIGKELDVYIKQKKILSRDKYGRPQVDDNPMLKRIEPLILNISELDSFGEKVFNWGEAIIPLSEEDEKEVEIMNGTLKNGK